MDIDFEDEKLKKMCLNGKEAQKKLGADGAKKLSTRLHELDAADNVTELVAGNPHPLENKGKQKNRLGQYSVGLVGGKRLIFKPNQKPAPKNEHDDIDWSMVTSIVIIEIGDYHD